MALPFFETAIIEHFMIVFNDERDDTEAEAFFKHDEPTDATVAVLKGVDSFKTVVKLKNIIEAQASFLFFGFITFEQFFNFHGDEFGLSGLNATDLIGVFFIIADAKPFLAAVFGAVFEDEMEFFEHVFRNGTIGVVDNVVKAAEMIGGFNDVVDFSVLELRVFGGIFDEADGVGFKNVASLFFGQFRAFDAVGIISHEDLGLMIDAAVEVGLIFFFEDFKEVSTFFLTTFWLKGGFGEEPVATFELGAFDAALLAINADLTLGDVPFLGDFGGGEIFHALIIKHFAEVFKCEF